MVFIGRGSALEGRIYELPDTLNPILTVQGTDTSSPYTSGQNGLVTFDNSGGRFFTDVTFDNFFATDVEPPRITVIDRFFGDYELAWPAEASRYVLQSSPALTGANWADVPGVTLAGDHYSYLFFPSSDAGNRFFRLILR
jgi:hypothetical protein